MDGEAGWWTTSGNIGLPPLARVMGVGRQQHNSCLMNLDVFFEEKIYNIRRNLSIDPQTEDMENTNINCSAPRLAEKYGVHEIILASPNKSYESDPIPTWFLKKYVD